jgi:chromate transporter
MIGTLLDLLLVFAKLSIAAFGGGVGIIPEMERQSIGHGWITHREFLDIFALGQITPGPGMLIAIVIGYKAAGLPGAAVAGTAMFLPSSVLAWVVAERWGRLRDSNLVKAVRGGMGQIAIGLWAAGTYTPATIAIDGALTALLAGLTVLALLRFRVSPAVPVLLGGVLGYLLFR